MGKCLDVDTARRLPGKFAFVDPAAKIAGRGTDANEAAGARVPSNISPRRHLLPLKDEMFVTMACLAGVCSPSLSCLLVCSASWMVFSSVRKGASATFLWNQSLDHGSPGTLPGYLEKRLDARTQL